MSTIVPHKRCNKCGNEYPQNAHFFNFRHKEGRLNGRCRGCQAKWSIDYFQYVILRDVLFQRGYRQCSCCNKILPTNDLFYYPSRQRGGLSTQCRGCHMNWSVDYFQIIILKRVLSRRGYKQCTVCFEILPATLEYFGTMEHGLNGVDSDCIACGRKRVKAYREAKGIEWQRIRHREYIQKNPGLQARYARAAHERNPGRIKRNAKRWRDNHKELLREIKRRDYLANRDYYLQTSRKRYRRLWDNDPAYRLRSRIYGFNRRTKIANLPYDFSVRDYHAMMDYWGHCCAITGKTGELHTDHWIPVAYEGADNPGTVAANLVPLLKEYNLSKQDTLPAVWLRKKFDEAQAAEIEQRIEAYFEWVKQRKSQSV